MPLKSYYVIILLISSLTSLVTGFNLPINVNTKKLLDYPRDSLLNFTELIRKYGYVSEEHKIVTEDGYILTAFRIVKAKNCCGEKRKPPVLLMHGLLQSSDAWIDSGPSAGLAYLIADACYDLWVGNVRGNYYSRSHIQLNPDQDAAYWQFSIDEIGYYDTPALINYVLNNTKMDKLNYIGFSQGGGMMFVMCSERPSYCNKINLAISIAPAVRLSYSYSIYLRALVVSLSDLEGVLAKFGIYEVFSKGALIQELLAIFCQLGTVSENLCATGVNVIDSYKPLHPGSLTDKTIATLFGHFPAGTSVHNIARYGQAIKTDTFSKYDYGKVKNVELYGSESPPEYNLTAAMLPVMIIYSENDGLVDTKDVKWLVDKLPHVLEAFIVKDPLWNHLDFTYSQYTREFVMPKINEYLSKYSYN